MFLETLRGGKVEYHAPPAVGSCLRGRFLIPSPALYFPVVKFEMAQLCPVLWSLFNVRLC